MTYRNKSHEDMTNSTVIIKGLYMKEKSNQNSKSVLRVQVKD